MKRSIFEKLKVHSLSIIVSSIASGIGVAIGNGIVNKASMTCFELLSIFLITSVVGLIVYSIRYVALDSE